MKEFEVDKLVDRFNVRRCRIFFDEDAIGLRLHRAEFNDIVEIRDKAIAILSSASISVEVSGGYGTTALGHVGGLARCIKDRNAAEEPQAARKDLKRRSATLLASTDCCGLTPPVMAATRRFRA
jgi:hypothetical protein